MYQPLVGVKEQDLISIQTFPYLYSGGYITVTRALLFVFRWLYYCYMCTVICIQVVVPLWQVTKLAGRRKCHFDHFNGIMTLQWNYDISMEL